ncbi:MAG: SCP-like extracellular [Ruminococcus sp.]|nr:SCP-like extracellular [Ruminococcus sp.]
MMNNLKKTLSKTIGFLTAIIMIFSVSAFPTKDSHAEEVTDAQLSDMAIEIAFLVNELRAENGLNPVYIVPYLCDTARVRARECIGTFSHLRPDGSKFSTIIDYNLVPYSVLFENIAAGFGTPEETMNQWKNSPKHYETMLNPDITHMGVGVAYEPNSQYQWYWEQTFAIMDGIHFDNEYIPQRHEIIPQAEGDLTGDAIVDTFDYLILADYLYKMANNIPVYLNDAQLATADCFRDGLITESDAKVLVRYILGEYSKLPYIF